MVLRKIVLAMSVVMCASIARGAISTAGSEPGQISPADPSAWTSSTMPSIGDDGVGVVTVDDGSDLVSSLTVVGKQADGDGTIKVIGSGSTWTNSHEFRIGSNGTGKMEIASGGYIYNELSCRIGDRAGSSGQVTVSGSASIWTITDGLNIGSRSRGTLDIIKGGTVNITSGSIGSADDGDGVVTVSGAGSVWNLSSTLYVGFNGQAELSIADGGLVRANTITIDVDADGDAFVTMATGGMLATSGNHAGSLQAFLDRVSGTDDIRYWDDAIWDWSDISGASAGDDYTLAYHTSGDLNGYTVLTVTTAPEPATLVMLALGSLAVLKRRRSAGAMNQGIPESV